MEGVGGKKKGCRCRVRVEETHSYVQIPGHPVQSVQSSQSSPVHPTRIPSRHCGCSHPQRLIPEMSQCWRGSRRDDQDS